MLALSDKSRKVFGQDAAQQSVHLTLGILRQSQAVPYALSFLPGLSVQDSLVGRLRRPRLSAGNSNHWTNLAQLKFIPVC